LLSKYNEMNIIPEEKPSQEDGNSTKVVSSNPVHGEVYLIQPYVTEFVSDLRQVGGFLRFPPPIKLTATIQTRGA
jgi:hypothetical protein